MTEISPIAAFLQPEDVVSHTGSIGRPANLVDFCIFDEDCGEKTTGEVGELALRGPSVFAGYWNNPDATAAAIRNGWFHTGAVAQVDGGGYYTLVARKKDMVITGDENVYRSKSSRSFTTIPKFPRSPSSVHLKRPGARPSWPMSFERKAPR